MKKLISVILVVVMVCAMSITAFAAGALTAEVENLNKISNCDTTTKYLDDYNLAVFKKGSDFVIWTDEALTGDQQAALEDAIEASGIEGLADLKTPTFASGFDTFDLIGQNVTITQDGTIQFEDKATWSWFYRGNYKFPTPAIYDWIQTGDDSATGYDPNGIISKNWFMYNTVDVAGMEIGASETFDIQAGNPKSGTNFVGTYTVTKVGVNNDGVSEYKITYDVNEWDETHKFQFDGYHLWFNGTGEFENSPGNQKGKATLTVAGETFAFAGDTLYVFAHFNVSYWAYVEV